MKMLRHTLVWLISLGLAACSGGGGGEGDSPFGGGGGTTPPVSAATAVDVIASAVQIGSGGDQVTISAIVKGAGNVALADAPVTFSTDSGTLTSVQTVADDTGVATATLAAGANKSNRNITVTATSGGASGQIVIPVVGTVLTYAGVTTVTLGNTASVGVKAVDSKGAVIAGLSVAVSSSLNNGLSASSITTDSQGTATLTYTATNAGSDNLRFDAAGATVTSAIQISAEAFSFISPAAGTRIPVGTTSQVTLQYLSNGAPVANATILFAITAGSVTPSGVTGSNGQVTVSVTSTTASPATVQATFTNTGTGASAQATLPIQFVAGTPARLVLQTTPTAVGPNPGGATAQQARILATVTDAAGNPVSGIAVNFNRIADPSGGNLSLASATTDSSGQASVQFIAGPNTTASNGVVLAATVATDSTVTGTASLTVNQSALFIALGTGNVISNIDPQTYKKDWTVYVTDANGVAVPNITLTIKVLPTLYRKGRLVFGTASWGYAADVVTCANEDVNYNGVLDGVAGDPTAGEDSNGSFTLEPGNVISVTTSNSTTSGSTGVLTTDATGRGTISLIYAESYAPWVQVKLRAEAIVSGTESFKEAVFFVNGSSEDFSSATNAPAGVVSPFGSGPLGGSPSCSEPN
ncbi:MAG: Ig-like domain-containing protein [Burkholderiales bacterium]|nr:Ig-like domain-containing protein [Burkholderiales bacterium]